MDLFRAAPAAPLATSASPSTFEPSDGLQGAPRPARTCIVCGKPITGRIEKKACSGQFGRRVVGSCSRNGKGDDRGSGVMSPSLPFAAEITSFSYSRNPPVLHRKECFVTPDYANREKFRRLTAREEAAGLLEDTETIGTREGWAAALERRGYATRGHRLVHRSSS